ncbi:MAG: preprotein translocase subunit SecE [Cyanobacteria bacterium J06641_5]
MARKQQAAPANDSEKQEGFNVAEFLKDTRGELTKVVWPSRKQLISESAAVIFTVGLVAALIYLFDNFFVWVAGKVFG